MDALQAHLEFLFSDANLSRDAFLRGQLTTTGRVTLRTLLTFPKVSQLARDAAAAAATVAEATTAAAASAPAAADVASAVVGGLPPAGDVGAGAGAPSAAPTSAAAAAPAMVPTPSVALATAAARARGLIFSFAPDTPATEGSLAPARAWELRAPGVADARTVYVETLPACATLEAVEALRASIAGYFSRFGPVSLVSLPRWRAAGAQPIRGRTARTHAVRVAERGPLMGFGFVEFEAEAAVEAAVAAHRGVAVALLGGAVSSADFDGRSLRVLTHKAWAAFKQLAKDERCAAASASAASGNVDGRASAEADVPAGVHIRIDGLHPRLPYASLWALVSAAARPAYLHAPEIFSNGARPPDAVRSGVARGWARRVAGAAARAARIAAAAEARLGSDVGVRGVDEDAGAVLVSATARYRTPADAAATLSFLSRGPRPLQVAGSLLAVRLLAGGEDDSARAAAREAVAAAAAARAAERAEKAALGGSSRGGGSRGGGGPRAGAKRGRDGGGEATAGGASGGRNEDAARAPRVKRRRRNSIVEGK
jgi:hypothetical protein